MKTTFQIGDHVSWNSEAGYIKGKIIKIHTTNFNFKGYVRHCTEEEPQYEVKSDKTGHIAVHKGSALKKVE